MAGIHGIVDAAGVGNVDDDDPLRAVKCVIPLMEYELDERFSGRDSRVIGGNIYRRYQQIPVPYLPVEHDLSEA